VRRRNFIALLGSAAAWPLAARAQQVPVIGFLSSASPETYSVFLAALRQGLSDAGFVEPRNCRLELRWAFDQFDRLPALAAELVGQKPAVIVTAGGLQPALAAKAATASIPIVFASVSDPARSGWSQASTGRAVTSPASMRCSKRSMPSGWNFCAQWCPRLR
jgi:putative tryptophan/tyrosine transport system substrate-binding protein